MGKEKVDVFKSIRNNPEYTEQLINNVIKINHGKFGSNRYIIHSTHWSWNIGIVQFCALGLDPRWLWPCMHWVFVVPISNTSSMAVLKDSMKYDMEISLVENRIILLSSQNSLLSATKFISEVGRPTFQWNLMNLDIFTHDNIIREHPGIRFNNPFLLRKSWSNILFLDLTTLYSWRILVL
jgi:hypothetical protein